MTTSQLAQNNIHSLSSTSEGQKSAISFTGPKPRCQNAVHTPEALGENPFTCLSQLLVGFLLQIPACLLWLMAPLSIFNAGSRASSNFSLLHHGIPFSSVSVITSPSASLISTLMIDHFYLNYLINLLTLFLICAISIDTLVNENIY